MITLRNRWRQTRCQHEWACKLMFAGDVDGRPRVILWRGYECSKCHKRKVNIEFINAMTEKRLQRVDEWLNGGNLDDLAFQQTRPMTRKWKPKVVGGRDADKEA